MRTTWTTAIFIFLIQVLQKGTSHTLTMGIHHTQELAIHFHQRRSHHPSPSPPSPHTHQPPGAGETRQIKHHSIYDSTNLTYMIQFKRYKKKTIFIGETKRTLRERFKEHRQATNNPLHANATAAVSSHFNQPSHSIEDMELLPLELQPPSAHVTP